ncbi:MAPEG family protein [Litoribacillus peritrichatus]|uniref:Prostaglandin E synthase n=1 Tax=Litoribacillus peritrichatus TaxID=718191 RepID=A0ABP7MTG9_9GAMM
MNPILNELFLNDSLLKYWVISAVVLFLKMSANSVIQGFYRMKYQRFVNPEDAKAFGALIGKSVENYSEDHPMAVRAAGCWRNDLENIPMFLILGLGFVLMGGNTAWGLIYFSVFTVSRVFHTVCFMLALQPWRNIAYDLGLITGLVMALHLLIMVF